MPIQGTLSKLAELKDVEAKVSENVLSHQDDDDHTFVTTQADPQEKLDHMELTDYLKNKGQWTNDLITENPPNLEQFLTGQSDAPVAAAKGGAKGAPAKGGAAAEQITLEEGDAELPTEAPNNYQLGDALQEVI